MRHSSHRESCICHASEVGTRSAVHSRRREPSGCAGPDQAVWPGSPFRNSCRTCRPPRENPGDPENRERADRSCRSYAEGRRGPGSIRLEAGYSAARSSVGRHTRRRAPATPGPFEGAGDYAAWSVNCSSKLMVTSSPRVKPPASRAAFQLTPKSWRLILVDAVNPALVWP